MTKRLTSILCSLLTAILLLPSFSAYAEPQTVNEEEAEPTTVTETAEPSETTDESVFPEIGSDAVLLYNPQADSVLFEKNSDSRIYPAAFTKLMTALLAFEYRAEVGNQTVTVTEEMLSAAGGTSMKLKVGEILSFDDLLSGLVVQSANDAALVLASVVGGNISAFVDKMNERAEDLGMEHTYYANPTGIDSAVMYTTLADTLTLCSAIYRVNDFMLLSETPKVTIPATNLTGERSYTNKNALIPYSYVTDYYTEGVRGMVAGYTQEAGYCVATMRQKENISFFVLVSGGKDRSEKQNQTDVTSYRDATALLKWAENTYAIRKIAEKGKVICEKNVRLGAGIDHMILVTGDEYKALLPISEDLDAVIETKIITDKETFSAPIIEGECYGTMELIYQGEVLGTIPLVAQSNIGLSRWLVMWDAVSGFFSQGPAKAVLILAIIAAVLYVLILIGTVAVQYARKNRARRLAISEMNELEKRRMKKVRLEEKRAHEARMKRVKVALREGYRVLSGDADTYETSSYGRKKQPERRAVAKVPEKYRKENRSVNPNTLPTRQAPRPRPVAQNRAPLPQNNPNRRPPNTGKAVSAERYQMSRGNQSNAGRVAPQRPRNAALHQQTRNGNPTPRNNVKKWPD